MGLLDSVFVMIFVFKSFTPVPMGKKVEVLELTVGESPKVFLLDGLVNVVLYISVVGLLLVSVDIIGPVDLRVTRVCQRLSRVELTEKLVEGFVGVDPSPTDEEALSEFKGVKVDVKGRPRLSVIVVR